MSTRTRERRPAPSAVPEIPAEATRHLDTTPSGVTADRYSAGTLTRWHAYRDRVNGWRDRYCCGRCDR